MEISEADVVVSLKIPFKTTKELEIIYNSFSVDEEPKRGGVIKTLTVEDDVLNVKFSAKEERQIVYGVDEHFVRKSSAVLSLNGEWNVVNKNRSITIEANVPGGIYTDLMRAGVIGDPYYQNRDVLYRWIGQEDWTFYKNFEGECELLQKKRIILVFHGLDTVGEINLNGEIIGISENMFVRYIFDVKNVLKVNNSILVSFKSPVKYAEDQHDKQLNKYLIPPTCPPPVQKGQCHVNYIRKIQSSFSWDWGPSFPSQGIWKPVEVIGFNTAIIRDVVVFTEKSNVQTETSSWKIRVDTFLDTASADEMQLDMKFYLENTLVYNTTVFSTPEMNFTANISTSIDIPEDIIIKEWWPNGLGNQTLYKLKIAISVDDEISVKEIRIGFRTLELVQEGVENSTGLSFYFRVNGIPFFAKGSNWIPADSFPERVTPEYTRDLLKSVKEANMNMLRVWGGGAYETDIFYDIADELGILIWQDIMFAVALYPTNQEFLDSVTTEVQQQVRRLQHHPSLLLWAGNNENEQALADYWWPVIFRRFGQYKADYIKLYVDTIMPIVQAEDPFRPFLTSSPSNGELTKDEGWVSTDPQNLHYGDVHFYTYRGAAWDWRTYPRARFISEYGFQSYPSFESFANVSEPSDWTYPLSSFLTHRQHHMFGNLQISAMISKHMPLPSETCGEDSFKDLLYLSQVVQAMSIKTETEMYRRSMSNVVNGTGKTMGALYWQLNDIWQGPSWSSIEYGGKWKMLHYFAKKFFSKVLVSPFVDGNQAKVSVVSDLTVEMRNLELKVYVYKWNSFTATYSESITFDQPPLASREVYIRNISGSNSLLDNGLCPSVRDCFLYFTLNTSENYSGTSNFLLLGEFTYARALEPSVIKVVNVTGPFETEFSDFSYNVFLNATNVSVYVWLSSSDLSGTFSDNGFFMLNNNYSLFFYSLNNVNASTLSRKIMVRSLMDTCK